jgi:thioredoxin 1
MNPVMAELARQYSGKIMFLMVDVYKNQDLASQFGVKVIPTILFIDASGKPVAYSEGYASVDEMKSFIGKSKILK